MTYLHFKVFIVYRDASLKTLQFVPNVLKQTNYKMSFKTLGTSVINSPLSPLSLSLSTHPQNSYNFLRYKTMADKLMYTPNDDTQT